MRVPAVHHVGLSALTAPDHSRSSGSRSDCPRCPGWLHGVRTDRGRIVQLALQHRGVKQRIVIGERPTARESSMAPLGGAAARSARRALAQTCCANALEARGPAKIGFFGIAHFRTSGSQDLTRIWGLIWGDSKMKEATPDHTPYLRKRLTLALQIRKSRGEAANNLRAKIYQCLRLGINEPGVGNDSPHPVLSTGQAWEVGGACLSRN